MDFPIYRTILKEYVAIRLQSINGANYAQHAAVLNGSAEDLCGQRGRWDAKEISFINKCVRSLDRMRQTPLWSMGTPDTTKETAEENSRRAMNIIFTSGTISWSKILHLIELAAMHMDFYLSDGNALGACRVFDWLLKRFNEDRIGVHFENLEGWVDSHDGWQSVIGLAESTAEGAAAAAAPPPPPPPGAGSPLRRQPMFSVGRAFSPEHGTTSSNEGLPAGWMRQVMARSGKVYYVNLTDNTTTWLHPDIAHLAMIDRYRSAQPDRDVRYMNERALEWAERRKTGDPNGPLPMDWERITDERGRVYYADHSEKSTHWEHPNTQKMMNAYPLPPGWSEQYTELGIRYFSNITTRETTFRDPRLEVDWGDKEPWSHFRDFRQRRGQFRFVCTVNQLPSHVKLYVDRNHILDDTFQQVMRVAPYELRRRIYIKFEGEEGLDFGGISKEWFFLVSQEIFNPIYGLFVNATSNGCLQINPGSFLNVDHLKYFKFIGRFLAAAMFHGYHVACGFSLPFYKKNLLGKDVVLDDIEALDEPLYKSLAWMRDNNLDENDLGMTFSAELTIFDKSEHVELKPNGKQIAVTEANKQEYLDLMAKFKFSHGVEAQTRAFIKGFSDVFPLQWLKYLDEREIELILCGMHDLNVDDWAANSAYEGGYDANSDQITWFFEYLKDSNNETRSKILQFVIGTCRLPVGGFARLTEANGEAKKFTITRRGPPENLPTSHTCFNTLDLPPYPTKEILVEKFKIAVEQTSGFGVL